MVIYLDRNQSILIEGYQCYLESLINVEITLRDYMSSDIFHVKGRWV